MPLVGRVDLGEEEVADNARDERGDKDGFELGPQKRVEVGGQKDDGNKTRTGTGEGKGVDKSGGGKQEAGKDEGKAGAGKEGERKKEGAEKTGKDKK